MDNELSHPFPGIANSASNPELGQERRRRVAEVVTAVILFIASLPFLIGYALAAALSPYAKTPPPLAENMLLLFAAWTSAGGLVGAGTGYLVARVRRSSRPYHFGLVVGAYTVVLYVALAIILVAGAVAEP